MKDKYLILLIIGVILVIAGRWLVSGKIYEGLVDTSTVAMVTLSDSTSYYADQGLTNTPNWNNISGAFTQVSGSYGQLVAVSSLNQANYGTEFGAFNWKTVPGTIKQVSFDYPMVCAITPSGLLVYIDNITSNPTTALWITPSGSQASKAFNCISISMGRAYAAGTDNKVWYCPDFHTPVWVDVSTGVLSGIPIVSISFDGGEVVVVDSSNRPYYANKNIETAPNWIQLGGALKQISMKNHMAVGIGTDNNIYFASSAKDGNWAMITKPTGLTRWVELLLPRSKNMISFRPATINPSGGGYICNTDEVLQNGICATKCPSGTFPDGELCQSSKSLVPMASSSIKCTSTASKWLCNTTGDAVRLLKDPSTTTTYVSPTDKVCVAKDETKLDMYFCISGAEAKISLNGITLKSNDYSSTCNNINKSYTDLSNNLTNLILIQNGMNNGNTQLGTAKSNLMSIYTKMNCANPPTGKVTLCSQILTAANSLGNNSSNVNSIVGIIIPQIQTAINARDNILGYRNNFACG